MKIALAGAFLALLWNAGTTRCLAQDSAPEAGKDRVLTRSEAVGVIAQARKITSPNGVESLLSVKINGATEWLSIRGKDKRNPILLFVHGGPGLPFMPSDWTVQASWEDYFTVVQWDQRGAGKTFCSNDPKAIEPTMTIDQMTDDAVQVVSYLRESFHKQKIIIVGHSWGTVLGVGVAQKHPDWLYAYVGVGQFVDSIRNEADGYQFALAEAKSRGNVDALKELESIAPYPGDPNKLNFEKVGTERKWVGSFGGLAYGRANLDFDDALATLSPDYTLKDVENIGAGAGFSAGPLIGPLFNLDLTATTKFKCPIFLFEGRHDYATSHALAAEWFTKIRAPQKKLVWFEDSAHMVMLEEPGRFLNHLVLDVRPIAEKAGDAAPSETIVQ